MCAGKRTSPAVAAGGAPITGPSLRDRSLFSCRSSVVVCVPLLGAGAPVAEGTSFHTVTRAVIREPTAHGTPPSCSEPARGRAVPARGPRAHPAVRWCEQIRPLAPERGRARMIRNVNASARGSDHT